MYSLERLCGRDLFTVPSNFDSITMNLEPDKVICDACHWQGHMQEVLHAPNPFDKADIISGCPRCKSVDTLSRVCDEPGCWRATSGGFPIVGGYRFTCFAHRPK